MRGSLSAISIVAILLLGNHDTGLAQWTSNKIDVHGMFGQRSLGRSLKPTASTALDGLLRGPDGDFRGRGRPEGGMMFGLSSEDSRRLRYRDAAAERPPWTAPPRVGPSGVVALPRRQTAQPAAEAAPWPKSTGPPQEVRPPSRTEPPEEVPPPDIWFRSNSSGAGSGARIPSAAVGASRSAGRRAATRLAPPLQISPADVRRIGNPSYPEGIADGSPSAVATRIRGMDRILAIRPIQVTLENETAILRGRVATDRDRRLAETLARFEPGIWYVRNELIVAPPALFSAVSEPKK